MRRTPLRTRYRDTGPDKATQQLVLYRAGHTCERCGDGLRGYRGEHWDFQHRRPRGMGGSSWERINSPENLLAFCRFCHSDAESRRTFAEEMGWLVPWPLDPANVRVMRWDHWCYLLDDGTTSADPPDGKS